LPHFEPNEEFEDEFDELFELEFDDELDELFELEFEELFELEFELELDELLPARMIWPVSPVTLCMPVRSDFAIGTASAEVAPRPRARAPVRITLRFMMFPFIDVRDGLMAHPERGNGSSTDLFPSP
jgi:hypothetical protein